MLAGVQRGLREGSMGVVGRRDDDQVDLGMADGGERIGDQLDPGIRRSHVAALA
jgi:hypothetical protein